MRTPNMIYRITDLFLLFLSVVGMSAQSAFSPVVNELPTRSQMPVANVNAVIQDSEGYMWYATYEGGLCRDNGYQIDIFRKDKDHADLLSDNVIYSLCEAPNGQIWFSTAHSVYVLDKHDYSIRPLSDVFRNISAQHIACLDNGNMLVEADTTVFEVSVGGQILSQRREKYQGRKVMIQSDGDGGHWICHAGKDLCYARGDTANVLKRYDVAAKNILVDSRRHLLFAITQEGLQAFPIDKELLGQPVYSYGAIPEIGVYGLYLDRRHNLWMTGYQPSFTIFTQHDAYAIKKLNIASPQFEAVYVDHLVPLGQDKLGVFKDIDYYSVYDLKTGKEHQVSCDTVTPPYSWKTDKLLQLMESLTDIDTLLVKDATIDAKGHLWVVFDQYVREINTQTGRQRDVNVSLGPHGRLPEQEWPMNNFCCIAPVLDGVCIGGAGGVCYLTSNAQLDTEDYDVAACVSSYDMMTNDGKTSKGFVYADGQHSTLSIGHDCTYLTLYLTSFNHVNASKIRFAVKVEGLDGDWVNMAPGENIFRLLNLPKGSYRVWLRATDENGLWGKRHEVLLILRQPAWWESWWAYTCYILLIILALLGSFLLYRYVQRKREQFNNMLRIVKEGPTEMEEPQEKEVIEVPAHDSDFSNKAIAIVKTNMDNENYTVDMLADALCMSRVNLYRKMMTVCGQTPSDFIKTLRMEHAHYLLTTTDLPVNIVAGKCGFTSSSYFAKCFKARFGVLPTSTRGQKN